MQINEKLEVYLKQYEICVDMADKISQRRGESNKFYLVLMSAFISALIAIFKNDIYESLGLVVILSLLGIAICIAWIASIYSYKNLNKAKYQVIIEMEKFLSHKTFSEEYDYLRLNNHIPLSKIEMGVPVVFIIAYFAIMLFFFAEYI